MEAVLKKHSDGRFSLSHKESGWWIGDSDYDKVKAHKGEQILSKLSIKNCEAVYNGYDLDELADNSVSEWNSEVVSWGELSLVIEHDGSYKHGFRDGFQKALQILGDKKFSEEDMGNAIEMCIKLMNDKGSEFREHKQTVIQSIKQTEWDVEILEEEPLVAKERQIHGEHVAFKLIKSTVFPNPLFDADGCLILKRI